jgi:hypothetical protein
MGERYDAVAVRRYEQNGEEKSAFTNIGVAWPMKERDGYSLRLHCLPAPENGEYVILLFPPKPKEEQPHRSNGNRRSYGEASGRGKTSYDEPDDRGRNTRELDDEIPF